MEPQDDSIFAKNGWKGNRMPPPSLKPKPKLPIVKLWEQPEMQEFVPELIFNFELIGKADEVRSSLIMSLDLL